jgi:hypothetical protein
VRGFRVACLIPPCFFTLPDFLISRFVIHAFLVFEGSGSGIGSRVESELKISTGMCCIQSLRQMLKIIDVREGVRF